MTIETAPYVAGLDDQLPLSTDMVKEGDNHIRLIKGATKGTFPRFDAEIKFSASQLNRLHEYTFKAEEAEDADEFQNFTVTSVATFKDIIEFPIDTDDTYIGDIQGLADIQFTTEELNDPTLIKADKKSRALNLGVADSRYILSADEETIISGVSTLVFKENDVATVVAKATEETLTVTKKIVTEELITNKDIDCKGKLKSASIETAGDLKVTGSLFRGSDCRLKRNIEELSGDIMDVRPVQYVKDNRKEYGIIAQELPAEFGHMLSETTEGYLAVDYIQLIPLLIKEVKDLRAELNTLKSV